jgi:hypothetical protein
VGLPEPYFMVPDNSLLQDLRRASEEERRFPRYVAIEGFAYFLRNYTRLDTRIVITPTIFFESIGMRELRNEYEYREIWIPGVPEETFCCVGTKLLCSKTERELPIRFHPNEFSCAHCP